MPRLSILLLLFAIPTVAGCNKFDHVVAERNHLRMVGLACENFEEMAKQYPENLETEGFAQFIEGETLEDEWGIEIKYELTESGYIVRSAGPDRTFGTIDDIEISSDQIRDWNQ